MSEAAVMLKYVSAQGIAIVTASGTERRNGWDGVHVRKSTFERGVHVRRTLV